MRINPKIKRRDGYVTYSIFPNGLYFKHPTFFDSLFHSYILILTINPIVAHLMSLGLYLKIFNCYILNFFRQNFLPEKVLYINVLVVKINYVTFIKHKKKNSHYANDDHLPIKCPSTQTGFASFFVSKNAKIPQRP